MDKLEAQKIILADIKQAKSAKKDIDAKIETWLAEYNGDLYGNERDGYSKLVVKDIKKAVEWFIPNAVEPFTKNHRVVKLEGVTGEDVKSAKVHERLLNYQFVRKFDSYAFIHDMMKVSATEGTVNIRTGWNFEEDIRKEKFENISQEELALITEEGMEMEEFETNDDGTFNVTAVHNKIKANDPTAIILKNEDFLPDPSCDSMANALFGCDRHDSSYSEMLASGKYDKADLDELEWSIEKTDGQLAHGRRNRKREAGGDNNLYKSEAKSNKRVTVYEYFGFLDMDGDGINEPIMATLVGDKLLEIVPNPYPDGELPYVSIPFSKTPFSLWGEPLAAFLSDNQKIRTSLMRGIIDNVARSNNAKKFAKKGSLDTANKRKYEQNLDGLIEYNGEAGEVFDGSYNAIPPSVFGMYEVIQTESESLSGINRTMQGTDSRGINDSATGAAIQQDMSQKRMMDVIRRHADGLKQVFRKWIAYNKEFLSDDEVMRINGEFIPFKRDDISGEFDINITVGTDGVAEAKVNQMTMLMQQVAGLKEVATIPNEFFNLMLAKLADEWGYPDVAQMLEKPKQPEPNPALVEAQKLELEKLKATVEELQSKAVLNEANAAKYASEANNKNVDSKIRAYGLDKDEKDTNKQ